MKNKLVIHACGGAGITQTQKMVRALNAMGDGYAKVVDYYLDTTDKNIGHMQINPDKAFIFTDESYQSRVVDGSGGERRTNFDVINAGMGKYMDKRGYSNPPTDEFHVVIFSSSGGSGSVIGPVLLGKLMDADIPTIAIVTGDRGSVAMIRNTVNTLMSLRAVVKNTGKPLGMYFQDNQDAPGKTLAEKQNSVDKRILSFLTTYSIFVSGENYSLDNQDMISLVDYTKLPSLQLTPDVVILNVDSGTIDNDALESGEETVMGIRSLTKNEVSPAHGIDGVPHWKYGTIATQALQESMGDHLPLHLYTTIGRLTKSILPTYAGRLKEITSALKKAQEEAASASLDDLAIGDGTVVTDDGMYL